MARQPRLHGERNFQWRGEDVSRMENLFQQIREERNQRDDSEDNETGLDG